MKPRAFIDKVQHDEIHRAIQDAESGTSARIVVYVTHRAVSDLMETAHRVFRKLKLETPEQKAGLLFFVAPKSRKFAVLGGTALHEKLGQLWWDHVAASITRHFKDEHYTQGLLAAIAEAKRAFHANFPSSAARPTKETDIYDR